MPAHSIWSGRLAAFLGLEPASVTDDRLRPLVPLLQHALTGSRLAQVELALGWRLPRIGRRVDAVIATDRAVLAILFRPGAAFTAAHRRDAEDAALDLADFHEASRALPILPIVLIPNGALVRQQFPLPLAGASPVLEASRLSLPSLLRQIARFPDLGPAPPWSTAAYRPVPGLIDAARCLYARHDIPSLLDATAGKGGLARTRTAIRQALASATGHTIVFVTGAPGAGKTLCGLDLAFGAPDAAFLTGNPTLIHVLREALVRDAAARGLDRRAAERRVAAVIQALPRFRDHFAASDRAPSDRLIVIDEAQRCWERTHAIGKTRNRAVALQDSEPGHLLDIVARRPGACIVCLIGGGQEIHDGEGGLAAWGAALASRNEWTVWAPASALTAPSRERLPTLPNLHLADDLHLANPVRPIRAPASAQWVDAVLADAPDRAAKIAAGFTLTRSLAAARAAVRPPGRPEGSRTAGLLASSTARRLRAEGLGAVLPHQDDAAVARWFLDRWPDIRSGDALETVATEFAVQGLELDRAIVCWDADLIRDQSRWLARRFRATAWTRASAQAHANRINAYRVLLTRARHGTIIWVPRGDPNDPTRDPSRYDAIADYLRRCGATPLDAAPGTAEDAPALPELNLS